MLNRTGLFSRSGYAFVLDERGWRQTRLDGGRQGYMGEFVESTERQAVEENAGRRVGLGMLLDVGD